MRLPLLPLLFIFILAGCQGEGNQVTEVSSCVPCHSHKSHLDSDHQIECTSCHRGNKAATDKNMAHEQLVSSPSHPDNMEMACAPCHEEHVSGIKASIHFTLRNSVNQFRDAYGAADALQNFLETPFSPTPDNISELADDLLRRRCFVCHLYNKGEEYPKTRHAMGCGGCHLPVTDGSLTEHRFQKPQDEQCLSCHYGNYVGFDYYGRFEHDLNDEYRTPFFKSDSPPPPYGIEYRQLQPDIHQRKGLICIDCHSGTELMQNNGNKPSCKGCHDINSLQHVLPSLVTFREVGTFILQAHNGKDYTIPLLSDAAHFDKSETVSCQGCHAQWTFNDTGKHFLRSDTDNFDNWYFLSNQGSKEVQRIIENNTDYDKDELSPQMTDKLTGELRNGLWHKGYTMRRWEVPLLGRDTNGIITTMRPLLDYQLSWIDEDDEVHFDSVRPVNGGSGIRAYSAHTIGSAGLFYRERIALFLASERTEVEK